MPIEPKEEKSNEIPLIIKFLTKSKKLRRVRGWRVGKKDEIESKLKKKVFFISSVVSYLMLNKIRFKRKVLKSFSNVLSINLIFYRRFSIKEKLKPLCRTDLRI